MTLDDSLAGSHCNSGSPSAEMRMEYVGIDLLFLIINGGNEKRGFGWSVELHLTKCRQVCPLLLSVSHQTWHCGWSDVSPCTCASCIRHEATYKRTQTHTNRQVK